MASDGEKGDQKHEVIAKSTGQVNSSEELDLDKNPILYRTSDGKLSPEAHDKDYMELILRSGQHSDFVKKIIRQRIELRAKEFPRWPAESETGVRVMWIESRFWYDRERFLPDFDDDWRNYRAKYLHSLELDPREPVHVPEYEKLMLNPIRRFYQKPGDWYQAKILSKFISDKYRQTVYRKNTARLVMAYFGFFAFYYYMRFSERKWESTMGVDLCRTAPYMTIDDPRYPMEDPHTHPVHYADKGFTRRKVYGDLRDYEDNTVIL